MTHQNKNISQFFVFSQKAGARKTLRIKNLKRILYDQELGLPSGESLKAARKKKMIDSIEGYDVYEEDLSTDGAITIDRLERTESE